MIIKWLSKNHHWTPKIQDGGRPPYWKSFLAITQQPIARFRLNFAWGSSFSHNFGNRIILEFYKLQFVTLQFGLRRTAAFVSSPIHLFGQSRHVAGSFRLWFSPFVVLWSCPSAKIVLFTSNEGGPLSPPYIFDFERLKLEVNGAKIVFGHNFIAPIYSEKDEMFPIGSSIVPLHFDQVI